MPPLPSPVMYGTCRIWLNMWPLVKSRIEMSVMAAHTVRFCTTGSRYGHATYDAVSPPDASVRVEIHRTQLIGRLIGGCGRSGRCRATQLWTCSAAWALGGGSARLQQEGVCVASLPVGEVIADRLGRRSGVGADGRREQEQHRGRLQAQLSPSRQHPSSSPSRRANNSRS